MGTGPDDTLTNRYAAAALLLLAAACTTAPAARRALPFWGALKPGRHDVGFRSIQNISVWYPAQSGGEPLHYRDYVARVDDLASSLRKQQISDQTIAALFDTRMVARRNAQSLSKPFPLIFIVQAAGQSDADHALLAEFLASHGNVVATIPSTAVTKTKPDFSFLRTVGIPGLRLDAAQWLHNVGISTLALASAAFPELGGNATEAAAMAGKMLQFVAKSFRAR